MARGTFPHRSRWVAAILLAGCAVLWSTVAASGAPAAGVAFDETVTVAFHDAEYQGGNGIDGADVSLVVVDPAVPDVIVQEEHGVTDGDGIATFSGIARPTDPGVALELQVDVVRERSVLDTDGCTVAERLAGVAIAAAGPEVTIDVDVQDQHTARTCPPPIGGAPIVVTGNALDPKGAPLASRYAQALLGTGAVAPLPVATTADGTFSVEVPAAADPTTERLLTLELFGPDVRTVVDQEGCLITWSLAARGTWTLVGDAAPQPRTLVAQEEALSGVCGGATSTPAAPAPRVTLPPTDARPGGIGPGHAEDIGVAGAMLLVVGLGLAAGAAALAGRSISRRGS